MSVSVPRRKPALAALIVVALCGSVSLTLFAQKPAGGGKGAAEKPAADKPAAAGEKKPRRALPPYYSAIVSDDQRTKIYAVQDKYEAQIDALAEQIKALQAKRDTDIESILLPEQLKRLEKARADAKAKSDAKAAARKPAEEKPDEK